MSYIALDFNCPTHGRFDSLVRRSERYDWVPCPHISIPDPNRPESGLECGKKSTPIECYAIRGKVRIGEMMRGKSDPRPPHVLDTTPLAEGVPYETWHEQESARLSKVLDE